MKFIATSIAALVTFGATWLVIAQFDTEIGRAGIYACALTAVSIVMGINFWQQGEILESTTIRSIGTGVLILAAAILLSLAVDLIIARVNPFVPSQWHNIWRSSGPFGFALTMMCAIFFAPLMLATVVRAAKLNILPTKKRSTRKFGQYKND